MQDNRAVRRVRAIFVIAGLLVAGGLVGRASAGPGTSGGTSSTALIWQGSLTGAKAGEPFKFEFKKGTTVVCTVNPSASSVVGDAVTVPVDYVKDGSGTGCATLFDGADVSVTVTATKSGAVLADQPLGPVGYAKYADRAVTATTAANAATATTAANAPWSGVKASVPTTEAWPGVAVATNGTVSITAGATKYVGITAAVVGGSIGGYTGGRALCAAKFGATAHICSAEEMARSAQLGISMERGWYTAVHYGTVGGATNVECDGWTSAGASKYAPVWRSAAPPGPDVQACNVSEPIACCN